MSYCVSVTEIRAMKNSNGIVYPLSTFSDAEIESAIDLSVEFIEKVCGTRFHRMREVWKFDGTGTDILRFPPAVPYPLVTVELVELLDEDGTVEMILEVDKDFVGKGHYLQKITAVGSRPRERVWIGRDDVWLVGSRLFRITGIWGNETPLAVKRAISLYTVETLLPGKTGLQSNNIASQSWPDYSVSFKADVMGKGDVATLTGFRDLDRLLRAYICHSTIMMRGVVGATLVSSASVDEDTGKGYYVFVNDPNFSATGDFWYNSTDRVWRGWNGVSTYQLGVTSTTTTPIPSESILRSILTLTADPVAPTEGSFWYNALAGIWKGYNGVSVVEFGTIPSTIITLQLEGKEINKYLTDPTPPYVGQFWFNETEKSWKGWNGLDTTILGS